MQPKKLKKANKKQNDEYKKFLNNENDKDKDDSRIKTTSESSCPYYDCNNEIDVPSIENLADAGPGQLPLCEKLRRRRDQELLIILREEN